MSRSVQLKAKDDSLKDAERLLRNIPNGVEMATMRSINDALAAGKTAVSVGIRKQYTVKASTIKETIRVKKASQTRLQGEIESKGKPLSTRHFRHSPSGEATTGSNRKPIRVTIKKGNSTKFKTGFLWNGGYGTDKHAIFVRTGEKRKATKGYHAGKNYKVEALKKSTSPSVPQMAGESNVSDYVQKRVEDVLESRMSHHTRRFLGKGAKK